MENYVDLEKLHEENARLKKALRSVSRLVEIEREQAQCVKQRAACDTLGSGLFGIATGDDPAAKVWQQLEEERIALLEMQRKALEGKIDFDLIKYRRLYLTDVQALVIQHALDMYVRIGIGQFEAVANLARYGLLRNKDGQIPTVAQIEAAQEHLLAAKQLLTGLSATACFGITGDHVSSEFKHADYILQRKLQGKNSHEPDATL